MRMRQFPSEKACGLKNYFNKIYQFLTGGAGDTG